MAVRDVVQAAAGVGGDKLYVEDVFSTYLYTGNGSTQTITNGIDLAGEGGLVWLKNRGQAIDHAILDTEFSPQFGNYFRLETNNTDDQANTTSDFDGFTSSGFTVKGTSGQFNESANNFASWTFRKAPKFFDVVEFTVGANGTDTILNHNLGSTPGLVITKLTSASSIWAAHHRSLNLAGGEYLVLNTTAAKATWDSVSFSDTQVNLGTFWTHASTGQTGIAYIFAHDAGGFGDDGEQNVISCGSYTGSGSVDTITLGWEPQFILTKKISGTGGNWVMLDTMRGLNLTNELQLYPNLSNAESALGSAYVQPTATGFTVQPGYWGTGETVIYIAIRRPMKTPESGTEVFSPYTTSASTGTAVSTGFPVDMQLLAYRPGNGFALVDRLRGVSSTSSSTSRVLETPYTTAEAAGSNTRNWNNTGFEISSGTGGYSYVYESFRRAPGFFDVVAYTGGTGTPRVLNHNLGVAPELLITKVRNYTGEDWVVHYNNGSSIIGGYLNNASVFANSTTAPSTDVTAFTATTYTLNTSNRRVNGGYNYIAYLFASCPGVSKIGSYTGTGTTQTINCGFSSGARFVLIKRTDSTGDWYVWDSTRGIVAGNDPYLLLNSTAAENTSTDYIDPLASGFTVTSSAPAALNASGGNYIFLAIA